MLDSLQSILDQLSTEFWDSLKITSQIASRDWAEKEWWHNKYYLRVQENDGWAPQEDLRGEIEIPYERKIFYPSSGRFGLANLPVGYFSNDFCTNCCETITQFREDGDFDMGVLLEYLRGEVDPDSRYYGYPIDDIRFKDDILLLDLTGEGEGNRLLRQIEQQLENYTFFEDFILSPQPESYVYTQILSLSAYKNGYNGIVYKSARLPPGHEFSSFILPDKNIVVFDSEKVYRKSGIEL